MNKPGGRGPAPPRAMSTLTRTQDTRTEEEKLQVKNIFEDDSEDEAEESAMAYKLKRKITTTKGLFEETFGLEVSKGATIENVSVSE